MNEAIFLTRRTVLDKGWVELIDSMPWTAEAFEECMMEK